MSFLEKEEAEKSSSFWDWVVGIGLVIAIAGFTAFYQYQKRSSTTRFHEADSLYQAGKLKEAGHVYQELKSAQYLTTHDDSTIYARMDSIETIQESQSAALAELKKKIDAKDTSGAAVELGKLSHEELLEAEDQAWIDSLRGTTVVAKP
jgi:predicted negative regulator of RcsB-dependent stress response